MAEDGGKNPGAKIGPTKLDLGEHSFQVDDLLVGIKISKVSPECNLVLPEGHVADLLVGIKVSKVTPECN